MKAALGGHFVCAYCALVWEVRPLNNPHGPGGLVVASLRVRAGLGQGGDPRPVPPSVPSWAEDVSMPSLTRWPQAAGGHIGRLESEEPVSGVEIQAWRGPRDG